MNIVERIQDNFAKGYFDKAMQIPDLPELYPAWTFKQNNSVSVIVPTREYVDFSETFAHAEIKAMRNVQINGSNYSILMLTCTDMDLRNEFATVCGQFVEPGENGTNREQLITAPEIWWRHWRSLLGNAISNKDPYPILGEMMMLEKLLKFYPNARWMGKDKATHDIELDDHSVEVKSTTERYGYKVTISSLYQLVPSGKPLYLAFFRFEKSSLGRSIDEVVTSLIKLGYPAAELEESLRDSGFEKGCTARNRKYKVLEAKRFNVDDNFPAVTEASFLDGKIPKCVVGFTYTLDLSGLPKEQIL